MKKNYLIFLIHTKYHLTECKKYYHTAKTSPDLATELLSTTYSQCFQFIIEQNCEFTFEFSCSSFQCPIYWDRT